MRREEQEAKDSRELQDIWRRLHLTPVTGLGKWAWQCQSADGAAVVMKTGARASWATGNFLDQLSHLYTPFHYPQLLALEPQQYLLYPYISGEVLGREDFEGHASRAAIMDLAGHLVALFRSLKLAPMYRALKTRTFAHTLAQEAAGGRPACLSVGQESHPGGLFQRRWEAMQSYQWAQELVSSREATIGAAAGPSAIQWPAFRARVEETTSIHLPSGSTNLAHTAFTPEHVLRAADGHFGIVGWQLGCRPYNYMRLKYLAWSLLHTERPDVLRRYRTYLSEVPTVSHPSTTALTFVLCLLETWPEAIQNLHHPEEKLAALAAFMEDSLAV